jgi:hypothetical protein
MPRTRKLEAQRPAVPKKDDSSEFDRAPRQKSQDRDPVKSAEQTRHIPTKHGALKFCDERPRALRLSTSTSTRVEVSATLPLSSLPPAHTCQELVRF